MTELDRRLVRSVVGAFRVLGPEPPPVAALHDDRATTFRVLRETRGQMLAMLEGLAAVLDGDLSLGQRLVGEFAGHEPADPRLIGDLPALRAWTGAMDRVVARVPLNSAVRFVWSAVPRRMRRSDRGIVEEARRRITRAFDDQDLRLLAGESIVVLDTEVVRDAIDVDAILGRITKGLAAFS